MKSILNRVSMMSPLAYSILKGGLLLACTLLFCSIVIKLAAGPLTSSTYRLHMYSQTLRELPPVILFEVIFGSAFIEEQICKRQ